MVQGRTVEEAQALVQSIGGRVTHRLEIINAVGTQLTAEQRASVAWEEAGFRLFQDRSIQISAADAIATLPATRDSMLRESAAQTVYNGAELTAKEQNSDSRRPVLYFNTSSLPSNAIVTSAQAFFWVTKSNDKSVAVHPITGGWQEDNATWNLLASSYAPTAAATFQPSQSGAYVSVNIDALTQQWVNGTLANNGIVLIGQNKETKYTSREWSNANQRPYLQ
ncbi:MAG TPA: DNRLRE domain-containing protein, partial [Caldilineaceae bacterium]|nr:DNRLRE domain-containing protein [Caldilineaceae bacterium]